MRRSSMETGLGIGISLGLTFTAACGGGDSAPHPDTPVSENDLYGNEHLEIVRPGGSVMAAPEIDSRIREGLANELAMVAHHDAEGFVDDQAAYIDDVPLRLDAHVGYRADGTGHDTFCNSLRIARDQFTNPDAVYLGVLNLSDGEEDLVQVSWSLTPEGNPSDTAQLCFDNGTEPSDGVVIFASDSER